jgi:hypothetical protein
MSDYLGGVTGLVHSEILRRVNAKWNQAGIVKFVTVNPRWLWYSHMRIRVSESCLKKYMFALS